jgi:hypothetical protein
MLDCMFLSPLNKTRALQLTWNLNPGGNYYAGRHIWDITLPMLTHGSKVIYFKISKTRMHMTNTYSIVGGVG